MSRVCAIHNEYCPDGDCKWCAPATADIIAATIDARAAQMKASKERLEEWFARALTPPNDGHGVLE